MADTFNPNTDIFGDTSSFVSSAMPPLDELQQFNDFSGDDFLTFDDLPAGPDSAFSSLYLEHPGDPQQMGWQSPPATPDAESFQDDSGETALPLGSAIDDSPAAPSVEDVVAENAQLRAMMAAMSDRMNRIESNVEPKTPPRKARPVHPQTTPRKRRTFSIVGLNTPPVKRPTPVILGTPGPIELMWSSGATPEQRQAVYEREMRTPSAPAMLLSPPSTTVAKQTFSSSLPAACPATPTPKRKPAVRKPRAPRVKKAPAPKKTAAPKERTLKELSVMNFMSLEQSDKARILLPLLQGVDPFTNTQFSLPGSMSVEQKALTTPAITSNNGDIDHFTNFMQMPTTETSTNQTVVPPYANFDAFYASIQPPVTETAVEPVSSFTNQADVLSAGEINALMSFNNDGQELLLNEQPGNNTAFSSNNSDKPTVPDGAARQREALEAHEQRMAEGRRR
jgi:hypothetical protein